jgi:hypothetical protein
VVGMAGAQWDHCRRLRCHCLDGVIHPATQRGELGAGLGQPPHRRRGRAICRGGPISRLHGFDGALFDLTPSELPLSLALVLMQVNWLWIGNIPPVYPWPPSLSRRLSALTALAVAYPPGADSAGHDHGRPPLGGQAFDHGHLRRDPEHGGRVQLGHRVDGDARLPGYSFSPWHVLPGWWVASGEARESSASSSAG